MKSIPKRVVLFCFIAIFNLIAMVNSASCQVNENELGTFFNDPQYRKHSADYFKTAKTYLDYEIKKYPRASASYQQYTSLRQLLFKKDPSMQAPPFLDVNTCEKGDIGMLSASGRFISYVKIFQILDDERSLMKCSFNGYAADDNWSGPFLWVGKKGTSWTAGSIKDGAVFALGIITFKKVDDYVYKNLLGGIRKVPAIEVLGANNWAAMVKKHKTTPTIKVIKRPSPSNSKPGLRTWKDLTGQFSIQADFVRVNGDLVVLQGIDKKEISLPLAKLSAVDQQYVKSRLTPDASASKTITNTIGMKLKLIPAGTFTMGSPETEKHRYDSETQHKVTITKAFYMQTAEVTQRQWKAVMGTEPWKGKNFVKEGPNYAASYVSWDDAIAYCKKLSKQENKTYRLPTEAEWEYACRAGTQTAWSFGDDEASLGDYAWCEENTSDIGEKYAHQVRLKNPNAFGLYDMHGNVWEWCYDYYAEDYYKYSPEHYPTGPASGSSRVLRGGSWFDISQNTRSAVRPGDVADFRFNFFGFRLVCELD